MNFLKEELIDMIFVLGNSGKNCFLASRMYAAQFPERRHPEPISFSRLLERFLETGSVDYKKEERNKTVTNEENQLAVLLTVTENPNISQARVGEEVGISERSVQRILKMHHFHPYHIQLHQALSENDFQRRVEFCEWARLRLQGNRLFFMNVLFSDEATFHNNGCVNKHNFHYYATENPRIIREMDYQHRWSINVWGGIVGEHVVGPYFFNGHLTGERYLEFLTNDLPVLLLNLPPIQNMWLQQDGAPAHFSRQVRAFLNNTYENLWIGRGGPVGWPARSPDLTKLDFFLWGYVKDLVYKERPTTEENMRQRIIDAFAKITPAMLRDVERSFQTRIDRCLEKNGRHFEHLLK